MEAVAEVSGQQEVCEHKIRYCLYQNWPSAKNRNLSSNNISCRNGRCNVWKQGMMKKKKKEGAKLKFSYWISWPCITLAKLGE